MNGTLLRWAFGAAIALAASLTSPAIAQESPVGGLAWLAGCWEMHAEGNLIDEQWQEPRGGTLLGSSRSTRGDTLTSFEFMRIYAMGETLVFAAHPSGQPPSEFYGRIGGGREVGFENAAHDFPQKVWYRAVGSDSLLARIEGTSGGRELAVDFAFERVGCPGPLPR